MHNDKTEGETASDDAVRNVGFRWGVKIPMRDGIDLNATLYKPEGEQPVPAIFTLTPYISDTYHPRAYYFARNGYAFLLVDCRGRGNSQGVFEPFFNDGQDGHDVVEWLAQQPWCDGKVAMWGGSYGGFDQWQTLKEFPPHLRTIVPVASPHAGVDIPFFRNIFFSYEMQWFTLVSGVTPNNNLFNEQSFWIEKFRERYLSHLPFKDLDQIVGNPSHYFQNCIQHPHMDAYWERLALTPEEYGKIEIPILTITGIYDDDQPGAMAYYRAHMQAGAPDARQQHYLIIGPWDHAGTRTPSREFAGLSFGETSMLDLNRLHKEWYDWTLKGGPKPEFLKDHIAYYLTGADEWKYASSLEAISRNSLRLHLDSDTGEAGDAYHSGRLEPIAPVQSLPDGYTYDPLDLRPADLEREEIKNYLTDQRYDLNLFGNGLVYHSAPFDQEIEITGYVKLVLWIELDVPDTDFWVTLSEMTSDGSRIQLTQDFMRARYRESLKQEKLAQPGEIACYQFDGFAFFSRRLAKGSRLRLLIRSPNSIFVEKNYNSGGVVALETGKDARPAHITLYHDADHPSFVELPLVS
jgi:putative CocE/NonD family hydrolase